jgi:hypothetical protein
MAEMAVAFTHAGIRSTADIKSGEYNDLETILSSPSSRSNGDHEILETSTPNIHHSFVRFPHNASGHRRWGRSARTKLDREPTLLRQITD